MTVMIMNDDGDDGNDGDGNDGDGDGDGEEDDKNDDDDDDDVYTTTHPLNSYPIPSHLHDNNPHPLSLTHTITTQPTLTANLP